MRYSCAAERSLGSEARHLAMNSPGVIAPMVSMRTQIRGAGKPCVPNEASRSSKKVPHQSGSTARPARSVLRHGTSRGATQRAERPIASSCHACPGRHRTPLSRTRIALPIRRWPLCPRLRLLPATDRPPTGRPRRESPPRRPVHGIAASPERLRLAARGRRRRPAAVLRFVPGLPPSVVLLDPDRAQIDRPFRVRLHEVEDFPSAEPRPVTRSPLDQGLHRAAGARLPAPARGLRADRVPEDPSSRRARGGGAGAPVAPSSARICFRASAFPRACASASISADSIPAASPCSFAIPALPPSLP